MPKPFFRELLEDDDDCPECVEPSKLGVGVFERDRLGSGATALSSAEASTLGTAQPDGVVSGLGDDFVLGVGGLEPSASAFAAVDAVHTAPAVDLLCEQPMVNECSYFLCGH